ncbi:DUF2784 family protein [candidate division KSB1 bacterium]
MILYKFLDVFFIGFHSILIMFNVLGWIWKPIRKANLITLLLTGTSWFLLGVFYGWGYCPLTDWHFEVLKKLGKTSLPLSYTEYLAERIFVLDFNSKTIDQLTLSIFLLALCISLYMNFLINNRKKNEKS